MPRRLIPPVLLLAALLLFAVAWARLRSRAVAPAAPVAARPVLTVVPDGGVVVTTQGVGRYDFGRTSLLDTTTVPKTFTLRNDDVSPLRITRIEAGCGCTDVTVRGADGTVKPLPVTITPGATVGIRAVVDFTGFGPGGVLKDLAVYGDASPRPLAKMEIAGTLAPLVRFEPEAIRFGKTRPGDAREVTVFVDSRLAPKGALPAFRPDSPRLRVQPLGNAKAAPGDRPMTMRRYRIAVASDSPTGLMAQRVSFVAPDAADSRMRLLESTRLLVFGDVE